MRSGRAVDDVQQVLGGGDRIVGGPDVAAEDQAFRAGGDCVAGGGLGRGRVPPAVIASRPAASTASAAPRAPPRVSTGTPTDPITCRIDSTSPVNSVLIASAPSS